MSHEPENKARTEEWEKAKRRGGVVMSGLSEAESEALYSDDLLFANLHSEWAREKFEAIVERIVAARVAGAEQRITERVEALADEWESWSKVKSTTRIDAFRDAADQLRAALARPTDEATP